MLSHRLGKPECSVLGLLPHHREAPCFLSASYRVHKRSSIVRGQAEAAGNSESISTDHPIGDENAARNGLKSTGDLRDLFRRADINR